MQGRRELPSNLARDQGPDSAGTSEWYAEAAATAGAAENDGLRESSESLRLPGVPPSLAHDLLGASTGPDAAADPEKVRLLLAGFETMCAQLGFTPPASFRATLASQVTQPPKAMATRLHAAANQLTNAQKKVRALESRAQEARDAWGQYVKDLRNTHEEKLQKHTKDMSALKENLRSARLALRKVQYEAASLGVENHSEAYKIKEEEDIVVDIEDSVSGLQSDAEEEMDTASEQLHHAFAGDVYPAPEQMTPTPEKTTASQPASSSENPIGVQTFADVIRARGPTPSPKRTATPPRTNLKDASKGLFEKKDLAGLQNAAGPEAVRPAKLANKETLAAQKFKEKAARELGLDQRRAAATPATQPVFGLETVPDVG